MSAEVSTHEQRVRDLTGLNAAISAALSALRTEQDHLHYLGQDLLTAVQEGKPTDVLRFQIAQQRKRLEEAASHHTKANRAYFDYLMRDVREH